MRDLMDRLNITDFDAASYVDKHSNNASALPNVGIAASGGGYRAMLNGAGIVAAFDSRTENSTSPGHLGGILHSSTYFSGLSGGAWLVGSMYVNNFTMIPALLGDSSPGGVWDLDSSILFAPSTISNQAYYRELLDSVTSKRDAGFEVSITDLWLVPSMRRSIAKWLIFDRGRALSYQLINATEGGIAYTWSSMALQTDFLDGDMPMPIAVAAERAPGIRDRLRCKL
jgi:lysophospholipase